MATKKFTVSDRVVEVKRESRSGEMVLAVDDHEVAAYHDPQTGHYSSTLSPYREFDDLTQLVASIVESHPDFRR